MNPAGNQRNSRNSSQYVTGIINGTFTYSRMSKVIIIKSNDDISAVLRSVPSAASSVSCEGVIRNVRKMKEHTFCTLQITDENAMERPINMISNVVQLVFTRSEFFCVVRVMEHIRIGASVCIAGTPSCDRPGTLSIYVRSVAIRRSSSEPDAIRRVLCDPNIAPEEAAAMLACTIAEVECLRKITTTESSEKELKHAVAKHSRAMVMPEIDTINHCSVCLLYQLVHVVLFIFRWASPAEGRDNGSTEYPS